MKKRKNYKMSKYNVIQIIQLLVIILFYSCKNKQSQEIIERPIKVPTIVYSLNPDYVDIYNKAWELAEKNINSHPELPQNPYIDEAFDENVIWIWDTCFMLHFFKYAPSKFPAIETLNNFYAPIHDAKKIPLRIEIPDNPPLFAWTEFEFLKFSGNKKHLKTLMYKTKYLQKHFEWFDTVQKGTVIANSAPTWIKKNEHGYQWEGGRSGMDNTPRGRTGNHAKKHRPNNSEMLWIDAIAQQGLSALNIAKLYQELDDNVQAEKWMGKYNVLKEKVNTHYWDETDGIYYDINIKTLEHMKLKTPASYWPMLAEMCDSLQAKKMVEHIKDPNTFGGIVPWTTLPRNDTDFDPNGGYWRGSVWLPTAYAGIKALEKYGYFDLARDNALSIIDHMVKTYQHYVPHTIWECYSPIEAKPAQTIEGEVVRPDFCGWSALGPISLLIENVIGFYDIDASKNMIKWNLRKAGKQGIKNLRFGSVDTDIIYENEKIEVWSNSTYILHVNGKDYVINKGDNRLNL